ncbi:MAG: transcriptional regulator GcvA [Steroidobacteraceae bacterium]|nr:transcriptional regulator GcvA [Steroidobacteraceae bacterium]
MSIAAERLPLNALRVFEAVATHLSFTAAARELGVTTAAVSAQVKALEADIGVPLFRRHTRAVALTQEGAELLPGVRRGLDELRRAVDRIRRERVGGMLNLSVPSEFLQRWLLPRLGEFTRRHPEIEVRFGPARPALDFGRDDFHAAILYGSGAWAEVRCEKLLDEWVFPVCSPALLAKLGPIETLADFARYPLIHSRAEPWVDWLRRVGGDTTRAETLPLMEDSTATLASVEQGKGVALARWSLAAADLAAGRLVRPMMPSVQQRSAWYLVAPPENFPLPKVVRFRAWLVDCCREFAPPTGEMLAPE